MALQLGQGVGQAQLGLEGVDDGGQQRLGREGHVAGLQLEAERGVRVVAGERVGHGQRQLGLADAAHAADAGDGGRRVASVRRPG